MGKYLTKIELNNYLNSRIPELERELKESEEAKKSPVQNIKEQLMQNRELTKTK